MEDLAKILVRNHDKLNILYNKYFYGFEKEGKSSYFQEKSVQGLYVSYRYPFREDLLVSTLMQALNMPIRSVDVLRPKNEQEEAKEAAELRDKQKAKEGMTKEQLRKYERELSKQKKIEADLEAERLLREEMGVAKRKVGSTDLYLERVRGWVLLEGKEEEQDYELVCNFNEATMRPMKNTHKRLAKEELGVLVYGRNLNESMIREVLKCARTQPKSKMLLRTRDNVTLEEIEALKTKYVGEGLPDGWFFNGYLYVDIDGKSQLEHPGLETLIANYIAEQNSEIGDFNREVQKEWKNDTNKYEI